MTDAWELWRRRSDEQVIAAAWQLNDYTDEGRAIIRSEMIRRGLTLPNPAIHAYRSQRPDGAPMDIVSVLPEGVVKRYGSVPEAIVGRLLKPSGLGGTCTIDNFETNPAFASLLHDVIARHGPNEPAFVEEARRMGSGKVWVIDGRSDANGFVPPEDIIGSFTVAGGMVVAGTYERNPNHVLISALGFFRLSPELHERLVDELKQRCVKQHRDSTSAGEPT